jgi:hypothetical protein
MGAVRMEIGEDGSVTGLLGGAIDVDQFVGEILNTGARAEAELVKPFIEDNADMGFDGERCRQLSIALEFEATSAFVVRDPARIGQEGTAANE